jgi:hypothetical protein
VIVGQWMVARPDLPVGDVTVVLKGWARKFGVTKPRIAKQIVTADMALMGYPYPGDLWTWKGEVNLLALPEHIIGSNPYSPLLDSRYRIEQ